MCRLATGWFEPVPRIPSAEGSLRRFHLPVYPVVLNSISALFLSS